MSNGWAEPNDSLRYACMDIGFRHRPLPNGQSKRDAFCANCGAARCVHHPEMKPREVRRRKKMPTEYPKKKIVWALYPGRLRTEPKGKNAQRDYAILVDRMEGDTLEAIAGRHGITRQRVHQIVKAGEK